MTVPRTPPRFVPTLTSVLDLPTDLLVEATHSPAEPTKEVPLAQDISQIAVSPAERLSESAAFLIEEDLLHRVLQRVDLSLEERLSDAVAGAVQAQLDQMVPRLRSEIESVLRSLVIEALAQELSDNTGSVPASEA